MTTRQTQLTASDVIKSHVFSYIAADTFGSVLLSLFLFLSALPIDGLSYDRMYSNNTDI